MTRRILALALAFAAALALRGGATKAYAAPATGSITLASDTGHDLFAYQVFDGDVEGDGSLADIAWGSGVDASDPELIADLAAIEIGGTKPLEGAQTAKDVAFALCAASMASSVFGADAESAQLARAVARVLAEHATDGVPFDGRAAGSSAAGLDEGWYVVASNHTDGAKAETALFPGLVTVGSSDVRIAPKESAPTLEKYVMEDSTGAWGKVADAETGEGVDYRLELTLPDAIAGCESVRCKIVDTLPQGMSVDLETVKVMSEEQDLTAFFSVALEGDALTLEAPRLEEAGLAQRAAIAVTYTATLREGACVGAGGSVNSATCEIVADGEPVTTPPSKTVTMTYGLVVQKVSSKDHGTLLMGAKFVLRRADGKFAVAKGGYVESWAEDVADATVFVTDGKGEFTVYGLDSDGYTLVETQAPEGYALNMEDFAFTVDTAIAFDVASEKGTIEAIALKGAGASGAGDAESGMVYAAIENAPKETTPETPRNTSGGNTPRGGNTPKTGDPTPTLVPLLCCGVTLVAAALILANHKEKGADNVRS